MHSFVEMGGIAYVELPKYNDGTYAYIGDSFEEDGHLYKIIGIEYRRDYIYIWGKQHESIHCTNVKLEIGKTLTKPKTKMEKIKEKLLGMAWTKPQAEYVCELIAEAYEAGKEDGQRGN